MNILSWMILILMSVCANANHNVFHTNENVMIVPIIKVIDGDTIRTSITLPSPLNKLSIRLSKIDTPESTWRAKCLKEKLLGIQAKNFLISYLKDESIMVLKNFKYGTYAGRIISDVEVNSINLSTLLIEKGYARLYDGKHKSNWCN